MAIVLIMHVVLAIISEVFVQRAVFFGLLFPAAPYLGHLTRHLTVQPR